MRIEEVVSGVALAGLRELDNVDEHVGEGIAGHRAVGSALQLKVEEEAAVAGENGDGAERSLALEAAQGGDFFEAGPVFVLEHHAGWIVVDDALDDFGGHDDGEQQGVILNDERDVGADGGDGLGVVGDDLVVGAEAWRRGDHDAGGTAFHDAAGEGAHGCEAGGGDAYDDGDSGSADDLVGDGEGFGGIELRSFAHDAEDGETGDAATEVEVGHAVDGGVVDGAIGLEGGNGDGVDTLCGVIRGVSVYSSFFCVVGRPSRRRKSKSQP